MSKWDGFDQRQIGIPAIDFHYLFIYYCLCLGLFTEIDPSKLTGRIGPEVFPDSGEPQIHTSTVINCS